MQLSRRGFIGSLAALVAAPAIVRVENLMALPKPQIILPEVLRIRLPNDFIVNRTDGCIAKNSLISINEITREAVRLFQNSNAFIKHINLQYEKDFAFMAGEQWAKPTPSIE